MRTLFLSAVIALIGACSGASQADPGTVTPTSRALGAEPASGHPVDGPTGPRTAAQRGVETQQDAGTAAESDDDDDRSVLDRILD